MAGSAADAPAGVSRRVAQTRLALLSAALLGLPVLVAVGSLIGRHWYAASDQGLEVLRITDVGGPHTPLYGVQSRFGWYHPGPALYWLTAPAYRVLGETGVLAAVGLMNVAALGGVVVIANRRGGPRLALLVALFSAVLLRALGPGLLIDVWNPWVAVVPFLLFSLLVWSVVDGDRWAWPWLVGVGSFVVQSHVGYAPLVVGLGVLAAAWTVGQRRKWGRNPTVTVTMRPHLSGFGRRLSRPLPVSVAVAVLAWLAPVVQQLTGRPGNLGELWTYFRDPPEAAAGWPAALGIMGRQLWPVGPWITGHDVNAIGYLDRASPWPGVVLLAVTAVLGGVAGRGGAGRGRTAGRLAAVAVVGALVGAVAVSRVTGLQGSYLVRWAWVLAMLLWLSAALSALTVIDARRRAPVPATAVHGSARSPRPVDRMGLPLTAVLLVALAAVTVPTTVDAVSAPLPQETLSRAVAGLAPSTAAALERHRRYLFTWVDSSFLGGTAVGLHLELESRGYLVLYERVHAKDTGRWRTATPATTDATLTVVSGGDLAGWRRFNPGARQVAAYDPLTTAERRRATALERRIRTATGDTTTGGRLATAPRLARNALVARGANGRDVDALATLQEPGEPYRVFLAPNH